MNPIHEATSCAVAATAEIIGAKWTALLVHDLSEGPRRFSELEHSCVGISPRTLSERLRALEDEGVVERRSYAESPPRVEYELTDKGQALLPIIAEMRRFGHAFLTDRPTRVRPRASRAPPRSQPTPPCPERTPTRAPSGTGGSR
jgi:DNA-binding HxlR family transcriptional regulator